MPMHKPDTGLAVSDFIKTDQSEEYRLDGKTGDRSGAELCADVVSMKGGCRKGDSER